MNKSSLEELMIYVLKQAEKPLTLREISDQILKLNQKILTGSHPNKSLYSVIYRREKKRVTSGDKPFFLIDKSRRDDLYSLNSEVFYD